MLCCTGVSCPFDITRKDVFCLAVLFKNESILFSLFGPILSATFVFSVSVDCSQIFTLRLYLRQKVDLPIQLL